MKVMLKESVVMDTLHEGTNDVTKNDHSEGTESWGLSVGLMAEGSTEPTTIQLVVLERCL